MQHKKDSSINWEAFVDAFAGPVLIIDPEGKIIYVNKPACNLLDKSKESLIK
jgi:PAS domain-containing protein